MCLSPHEMTVAQLQEVVAYYSSRLDEVQEFLADPGVTANSSRLSRLEQELEVVKWRLGEFEALLKERAEEGKMLDSEEPQEELADANA